MSTDLWTLFRTAARVAQLQRVSAAAKVLGMHHASVIRHIDALEAVLQTKLFQRHARGYTPTEAGEEILRVANMIEDQLSQMIDRIDDTKAQISGQLVVTGLPPLDHLILPVICDFQILHPRLSVSYHSDGRPYHLAYGEAHVALRAGPRPEHPDNVVSHLVEYHVHLYAHKSYVETYGRPKTIADLAGHRFITGLGDYARAPYFRWLEELVPETAIVFRTAQTSTGFTALTSGIGIGFTDRQSADADLIELFPDLAPPEWATPIWLLTHVDLHRTMKVNSFARFVLNAAKSWRT